MGLTIAAGAYDHLTDIPARYTCDGHNISPPLNWNGVPDATRSLVLVIDDPDAPDPQAPRTTWVHWVVYNLPASSTGVAEAAAMTGLPAGTCQALNDWKRPGYSGPCPPIGRHRYFHKLYALDTTLPDLGPRATLRDVVQAMRGHVLEQAEIIGMYKRKTT